MNVIQILLLVIDIDGTDYLSTSAVVTFSYGETLLNVTMTIIDDLYAEPVEYFTVTLEAIGQEVIVYPITECVIEVDDNDCKHDTI